MPDNETAMRNDLDDINAKFPDQSGGKIPVTGPLTAAELAAADPATSANQAAINAKLPASLGKKAASASFSVVQADPARTIVSHVKDLTGSAIALSAISVIIQDLWLLQVGSTGTAYFGDEAVQSGHGMPLSTTNMCHVHGPIDLSDIYVIGNAADSIAYSYSYEV